MTKQCNCPDCNLAREQAQKRIIEMVEKYIQETKQDIKYSCEDEQQSLMLSYLLKELFALKENISRQQIQSQKNPITTAEGVKIGRKSRITPLVMPEKVLHQSSDTIFQKEIEADAKRLNEIYNKEKNGKFI